jgi:hypothetical protein
MQQHIEDLKSGLQIISNLPHQEGDIMTTLEACIENAKTFFEKEKEQIESAWWAGHDDGIANPIVCPPENAGSLYYNEKYGNNKSEAAAQ